MAEGRGGGSFLGDSIKRYVAREIASAVNKDEEAKRLLVPLLGDAWFENPTADPGAPLRALRRLGSAVVERPSILNEGRLRALDLLRAQGDAMDRIPGGDVTGAALTVVFTDLEDFTPFTSEVGDVAAGRLLRSHYAAVDDIVEGRGGAIVKRLGDGHMATFPQPRAAVLASLELLRAAPEPLRLRVGGHVGQVTRIDGDIVGNTVNLASRVADHASGGKAEVTLPLRDATGDLPGVAFGDVRSIELKGIAGAVAVCEVMAS